MKMYYVFNLDSKFYTFANKTNTNTYADQDSLKKKQTK